MTSSRTSQVQTVRLPSGVTLAFAEYGDHAGWPVLHFHGHPGSRLEGALAHATASDLGVRLICPDRPGMGYSDFVAGRRLLDWPSAVVGLADHLGLGRFAVQGVSGGGPYALACALRLADRVTACSVIGSVGPIDRLGTAGMMSTNRIQFFLARWVSPLLRPVFWLMFGRHAGALNDRLARDRLVQRFAAHLEDLTGSRETAAAYVAETLEAFRQGTRGAVHDAALYARPWGFDLAEIGLPVYLWHGAEDRNVPLDMARAMAAEIPRCEAEFLPGDHMTVIFGCLERSLRTLSAVGHRIEGSKGSP